MKDGSIDKYDKTLFKFGYMHLDVDHDINSYF